MPLSLYGCIVDSDHPCGANQVESTGGFSGCECVSGSVPNAAQTGCDLCGANEEVKDGACSCKAGFARASATEPCTASQQGSACSASTPCNGSDFPYCAPQGYCTKSGCSSNADCSVGEYSCETTASPSYCSRPPVGQGKSCKTSDDCAAGEAKYCAMGTCLVSNCKTTTTCHGDYACCDFAAFGLTDFCVPSSQLSGGKCPGTNADPVAR